MSRQSREENKLFEHLARYHEVWERDISTVIYHTANAERELASIRSRIAAGDVTGDDVIGAVEDAEDTLNKAYSEFKNVRNGFSVMSDIINDVKDALYGE